MKYAFNLNDYQFAASIMFKLVRKVVAGPKRTTKFQGNQLDLTYISERIIAMAFPASDIIEKTYRNKIDDVVSYFNQNHHNSYLVMNVSSRIYDYDLFDQRVKDFEWPDHQAPTLPVLVSVAFKMYSFLRENRENVVAVHCNHGKGRTGTAIISFLLLIGYSHSASQCLKFYNSKRFNKDTYGVDQPCQVRYLGFLQRLMEMPSIKKKLPCFHLTSVTEKGLNENYFVRIKSTKTQEVIYDKVYINQPILQTPNKFMMSDIFIELFSEHWMGQRRISRINYNMYFIQNNLTLRLKGCNIKVDNGHSKQFEVIMSFKYHCLCHLPEYSETLCPCNYTRNFQELQWENMIEQISLCRKLTDDEISFLVHGYKFISSQEIVDLEFDRITKNQENFPPKVNKTFRNNREQKLYALSQAKMQQHEQYLRQNSDPSPTRNIECKFQDKKI